MPKLIDLTGQKFGRLTVLERLKSVTGSNGKKIVVYRCKCECGNIINVYGKFLRSGDKKSCGCLYNEYHSNANKINYKHGMYKTRLYNVWRQMVYRCNTKTGKSYKDYGGRGIKVCEEWQNDFMSFHDWAYSNGYNENAKKGECTIDRINVNGNYEPSNCRWVNSVIQARNKRHKGGISFNKRINKWEAYIGLHRKMKHLGNFDEFESAAQAREEAERFYWGQNV